MTAALIAIDWGSTNRRVFAIDSAGKVIARKHDTLGILAMKVGAAAGAATARDFAAEVAATRAQFGDLAILCAGMVGSNRGWVDAGYVPVPASLAALAAKIHWIEPGRTGIVPGVCRNSDARADVMRGEEVQLLGAAAAGMVPPDGLVCQPGTHAKWARLENAAIADFTTALTGELFALLGKHSLLSDGLDLAAVDGAAFRAGVARGAQGDLLAALFGARAALVLGTRDRADQASYVSGLLIGSDCAARLAGMAPTLVHVLADAALGDLYLAALDTLGHRGRRIDSEAAFVAGINAIRSHLP